MPHFLLTIFLFCFCSFVSACSIILHVEDKQGNLLEGLTIRVNKNWLPITSTLGETTWETDLETDFKTEHHVVIFKEGEFVGEQSLVMDCTKGYYVITVDISSGFETSETITLADVNLKTRTVKERLEDSPFSVQVIDMKSHYDKAGDVGEILNASFGVKLRTNGGLGATTQINLGGLQGKAVRLFKDGLPIELFGHGFSIGTLPTTLLERIEIYKGVMPIYLAADALGGGINFITRQPKRTLAEVAYEIASFNTHRTTATLYLTHANNPDFYGGLNSSFNYSANNYKVDAPFYDTETGRQTTRKSRRFHDDTRSMYSEFYAGIKNKVWAEDFRTTFILSDFYKEIQHDAEMNRVYGEAFSKEANTTILLQYKKAFLEKKLMITGSSVYSHFSTKFIDLATDRYNWDGKITVQGMPIGEINKGNNQRIQYDFWSTRLHASYEVAKNHVVEMSELFYHQKRKGSDPLGAVSVIDQVDVLNIPAVFQKNILALGFRSQWFRKSLESIVGVKYANYTTKGYTTDKYNFAWNTSATGNHLGHMAGLKWTDDLFALKLSYEYATRLPDEFEIFGDGRLVKENLDLKPERSHNLNLNGQYAFVDQKLVLSTNLFYRRVKDIIFLQLDIPFNRYINYEESVIKGIEFEANYTPINAIKFGFNGTYQDIRRIHIEEPIFKNLEGSRVPNIPYLFGNAFVETSINNLFQQKDRLTFHWNSHYTHRFFLKAIPKNQEPSLFGSIKHLQTSLIIPGDGRTGQITHNTAVTYQFSNQKISLSGEIQNIANNKLYDHFNVQRPGRSFHFKIVYQFL